MFKTLQWASHEVRTAYGVSEKSHGHNRRIPLQGFGQGNGYGPTGWAFISVVLFLVMQEMNFGALFLTAISAATVTMVGFAFVDDTDLIITASNELIDGETIAGRMQEAATTWEGCLKATGGALRPDKSHWYLIDFVWNKTKWEYRDKEEMDGEISIPDAAGNNQILERLEPDEAKETLGVFLSMDGNFREQAMRLRQKSVEFADCMRTGFVSRSEAWIAIKSTTWKTLEYPMEAISLTQKQWDYVVSPILQAGLPRSGMASSASYVAGTQKGDPSLL